MRLLGRLAHRPEPAPLRRPTGLQIVLWAALVAGFLGLSLRGFQSIQVGAVNDDAAYIILARSLAQSSRYGLESAVAGPAPVKFPFFFPLALAPLTAMFPANLEVLRLPALLATLATGAALFWGWPWFSRERSYWWALGVTGLCLWSPVAVRHSAAVMSDALFVALCLAVWALTERCARGQGGTAAALGLGCVLSGAIFTRSVGLLLLPCVAATLWLRRGRGALRPLAAAGAAGAGLLGLALAATPVNLEMLPRFYSAYGGELGASVSGDVRRDSETRSLSSRQFWVVRLHRHVAEDFRGLVVPLGGGDAEADFFARLGVPSPMPLVSYGLLALVGIGFARWGAQEGLSAAWLFALAYGALLGVWNWSGQRLLYPILPQVIFALLLGLEAVGLKAAARLRAPAARMGPRLAAGAAAGLLALLGAASLRPVYSAAYIGDLSERTAWVRAHAPEAARLWTEHPLIDHLYSGRRTYSLPKDVASTQTLRALPGATHADYILIAPDIKWQGAYSPRYSDEMLVLIAYADEMEAAGRLRLVYTSADRWVRVYQAENQ